MRAGRKFLDESGEGGARFRNFSFLSQFGRGLIFRQGQIESRFGSDFTALLFADLDVFLENKVVPEPGGAAEDDDCEKQNEEPLHGSNSAGGNFVADAANFQPRCAENLGRFLAAREEPVPEPADGALFLVAPSVMTVLAIKFLGNDLYRAKQADQCRSQELPRHLRILDVRGPALRAANNGGGNVRIACFPFDH